MSADNGFAVVRFTQPGGSNMFRVIPYFASSEPYRRRLMPAAAPAEGSPEADFYDDSPPFLLVDGAVVIDPIDPMFFAEDLLKSSVFLTAAEAAASVEDEYSEYGTEMVAFDGSWNDLMEQAQVVLLRRQDCKVFGPDRKEDEGGFDFDTDSFRNCGGPGIEDKLAQRWGWPEAVAAEVTRLVVEKFFDHEKYPYADNLRLARKGNAAEEARYAEVAACGCCSVHEEVLTIRPDHGPRVEVMVAFNFAH